MEASEVLHIFENYNLWLIFIGLAVLVTSIMPRVLAPYPISVPMVLFLLGWLAVALPLGLKIPNPLEKGDITERLVEMGVIISLMGAGLKIDRPPGLRRWSSTWRLLGITMILSIGLVAFIGWWIAAFVPATAVLLGAVIAPTDPVLASEIQVGSPGEGALDTETEEPTPKNNAEEDEVRFSLTSEAGLNDGLAFPFTNMAIAMMIAGASPDNWFQTWFLIDVLYKLAVGALAGYGLGFVFARLLLYAPATTKLAKAMVGLGALSATLVIYGATEYFDGYGFIAVFIGAVTIRSYERTNDHHKDLHIFTEKGERILTAIILLAFGGAVAGGLLEPLTWQLILSAILIVLIVRPVSGMLGLIGFKKAKWRERLAISFFGIKGIGSLYYLSFALNKEDFPGKEEIWALVSLVIVISIFLHGITAVPITSKLDKLREREQES